jgi:hypothetical protein
MPGPSALRRRSGLASAVPPSSASSPYEASRASWGDALDSCRMFRSGRPWGQLRTV